MAESLRGQFLLASKNLHEPTFFRSVILMLEHSEEGAMGVIVNRPSSVNVSHALAGHFEECCAEGVIYVGGPVEPSALSMLHDNANWGDEELSIIEDVYIGSCAEAFEELIKKQNEPQSQFRIYSGYAGWAEGQLEGEIERGDWYTLQSHHDFLFHADPYNVWDELICKFYKQHRILPIPTDKAEWN